MTTTHKLLLTLCCAITVAPPVLAKSKHTPIYVPATQMQPVNVPDTTDLQQELESLWIWELDGLAREVKQEQLKQQFEDAGQDLATSIETEQDRRRKEYKKLDTEGFFFLTALIAIGTSVLILVDPEFKKVCSPGWALAPVSLWVAGWCYPLVPRAFNYLMESHQETSITQQT